MLPFKLNYNWNGRKGIKTEALIDPMAEMDNLCDWQWGLQGYHNWVNLTDDMVTNQSSIIHPFSGMIFWGLLIQILVSPITKISKSFYKNKLSVTSFPKPCRYVTNTWKDFLKSLPILYTYDHRCYIW